MQLKAPKIFVLAILLIMAFIARMSFLSYKQSAALQNTIVLIQHTHNVLKKSEKILSLASNYEKNAISLQIKSVENPDQKLLLLKNEIKAELLSLKNLIKDNATQQQNITALTSKIERKLVAIDSVISFNNKREFSKQAIDIFNRDTLYNNDIKAIILAIQSKEEQELALQKTSYDKVLLKTDIVFYALGAVILLLLIVIINRIQKYYYEKKTNALSNEHLTLIDISSEAIISTDPQFNVVQWSKGAERLYGYTREEVLGKGIINFVVSKTDAATRIDMIHDLQKKGYWQGEVIQFDKQGNELNLIISYSQIVNVDGTIKGYTSTRTDITQMKKMQADLQKLNSELEAEITKKTTEIKDVFERMQKAFLAFDNNWKCTYVNKPIMKYLKATHEELIGKHIDVFFEGIQHSNFYKACIAAMDTQQMHDLEEYVPFFNAWFESSIYPSPQGVSIYLSDISQQMNMQQELIAKKDQLRSLSNHIQNLREEERKIIARELHDDLGQMATVLKIDIRSLKNALVNGAPEIQNKVNNTLETVDELIKKIRKISHELRPDLLDNVGLQAAIKSHCLEFEKKTGISCFFYNETVGERLPQDFETALFRICQESLTNVMRHADAKEVVVTLSKNINDITLQITDNGKGFDVTNSGDTLGLIGIKERAASIKSNLTIESSIGNGTKITVSGVVQEATLINENIYN